MITRRRFLAQTAITVSTLRAALPFAAGRYVRVGTYVGPAQDELEAGLAFGAAEADRSASLFGWGVRRVPIEAAGVADAARVADALIIGGSVTALPSGIPVLRVTCEPPDDPNAFTLVACDSSVVDRVAAADTSRRVAPWHASLERFGAEQLNDRYRAATGTAMTGDSWVGWFAMKILAEAALRTRSSDPLALARFLRSPAATFDGHKGAPLRFDARGRLQQPLYVLTRTDGGAWVVDHELPSPPSAP